jgi:hypothetical protein
MAEINTFLPTKLWRFVLLAILVVPGLALLPIPAHAESAISQGFQTTSSNISAGSLISVISAGGKIVGPANTSNVANLVGVAGNKPLIELSNGNVDNVQVIVGGSVGTLVSDINGDIKIGDKITASPIDGIGMKALSSEEVIGTAQANLSSVRTVSQTLLRNDGSKTSIKIGMIPVQVNVAYYTAPVNKAASSLLLPPFLQNLADLIAGRQVSPLRVLIGTLALTLGFVATIIMLYASIRNNLISIGRNPLARSAINKAFIDVILVAFGVLAVTLAATFVILFS